MPSDMSLPSYLMGKVCPSGGVKQGEADKLSPFSLLSQEARQAATTRMLSELSRAVAAASADGHTIRPPSFSLASAISGLPMHHGLGSADPNLNSRSSTPMMRSPIGSCDDLCGLAPAPPLSARNSLSLSPVSDIEGALRYSGAPWPRAGGLAAAGIRLIDQAPASPKAFALPPNVNAIAVHPSDSGAATLQASPPPTVSTGSKVRPPSAASEVVPQNASATAAVCAPCSLNASPLVRPFSPLNKGGLDLTPLPPGRDSPAVSGLGGSCPPTLPPPAGAPEAASAPQSVTLLPGGATPRIANLKSGCSDGLLLLSATAFLVARDGTSPSDAYQPDAKRQRL